HVHRSELRAIISFEREIHNWLWFGIEGGIRQNLQLNLTNSPHRNGEVLIKNKQGLAPLVNISLFLVPPRHWSKE
ncbi:MAG: hypothetical protein HC867_05000, partial [Bacteroidia bacterium]|nr:hypothetical protein [Bacteroidia bacterium]